MHHEALEGFSDGFGGVVAHGYVEASAGAEGGGEGRGGDVAGGIAGGGG